MSADSFDENPRRISLTVISAALERELIVCSIFVALSAATAPPGSLPPPIEV